MNIIKEISDKNPITPQSLKVTLFVNSIICTMMYFLIVYLNWEFYNPVKWIFELGTLTSGKRACILFYGVLYIAAILIVPANNMKTKTKR